MKYIYRSVVVLSGSKILKEDYFRLTRYKCEIEKETEKTYVIYDKNNKTTIKKNDMNKINTKYLDNLYAYINYYAYSHEKDLDIVKNLLVNKVANELNKRQEAVSLMIDKFNTGNPIIEEIEAQ